VLQPGALSTLIPWVSTRCRLLCFAPGQHLQYAWDPLYWVARAKHGFIVLARGASCQELPRSTGKLRLARATRNRHSELWHPGHPNRHAWVSIGCCLLCFRTRATSCPGHPITDTIRLIYDTIRWIFADMVLSSDYICRVPIAADSFVGSPVFG
jgi:hypothetical protein